MIKANELRIGNWLQHANSEGLFCQVKQIITGDYFDAGHTKLVMYEDYDYALLTEDWLLKFGFEKDGTTYPHEKCFLLEIGEKSFYCNITKGLNLFFQHSKVLGDNWYCVANAEVLKYVHQLQNLYFALTGQELEVKELAV